MDSIWGENSKSHWKY